MSDVFISYAHEDQPFVRRMVGALEAEGLSVWWDHTIPPGKSWDSFIAKGIAEARCCIVVWSQHSVGSDWVKEEATLAKDGHKFLPVQVDESLPPVGFRRIQAANLQNWHGDRSNAQWQLLVREARSLVGGEAPATPAPAAPSAPRSYAPPPPLPPPATPAETPSGRPPWPLIGTIGVAAVAVLAIVMFMQGGRDRPSEVAEAPAYEDTYSDPAAEAPAEAAPSYDPTELERLRRERDQAIETARNEQSENEQLRRNAAAAEEARRAAERANSAPPSTSSSSSSTPLMLRLVGDWRRVTGTCPQVALRFVPVGGTIQHQFSGIEPPEYMTASDTFTQVDSSRFNFSSENYEFEGEQIVRVMSGERCNYERRGSSASSGGMPSASYARGNAGNVPSQVSRQSMFVLTQDTDYIFAGSVVRAFSSSQSSSSCVGIEMMYAYTESDLSNWFNDSVDDCVPNGNLYYLGEGWQTSMRSASSGWRSSLSSRTANYVCDGNSRSCSRR